jgi:hypothetical protein
MKGTIRVTVAGKVAISREVGGHVAKCIAKRQRAETGSSDERILL